MQFDLRCYHDWTLQQRLCSVSLVNIVWGLLGGIHQQYLLASGCSQPSAIDTSSAVALTTMPDVPSAY